MDDIINNVINRIMADYVRELDEAVATLDIEVFKDFVNRWSERGLVPECFTMVDDQVLEISIRKMAIHSLNIPEEIKDEARSWLLSRGYDLEIE